MIKLDAFKPNWANVLVPVNSFIRGEKSENELLR